MATAAECAPMPSPPSSAFHERLALLAREYEQLGDENRRLRARLGTLAEAEPYQPGLAADAVWAPPSRASEDWELEAPRLALRSEQVHAMSPAVFSISPVPTPPAYGAVDAPAPPDSCFRVGVKHFSSDGSRLSSSQLTAPTSSRSMVLPNRSGTSAGTRSGPVVGWSLPGSADKEDAEEDKNVRGTRMTVKIRKAHTHGDMPQQDNAAPRSSPSQRTYSSTRLGQLSSERVSHIIHDYFQHHEDEAPRKPVFANASDMKEKVRQQINKEPYVVTKFYKSEGVWQYIARHPAFEHITLLVIFLNAIWIAVDADYNKASVLNSADTVFQVVENIFCSYFTLELFTRFMAFQRKRNCFRDAWFCFDFALVMLMVGETWVMSLAILATGETFEGGGQHRLGNTMLRLVRLVRLTRMARMARLLRAMPELMILVKGMVSAARCVSLMLLLLGVVLYVFAIAFQQLLQGTDAGTEYFHTVLAGMHTLWIKGALLDDISTLVLALQQEGVVLMLLLDVFVLIATLTVMNMLIGVLCEVVSAVAAAEREDLAVQYAKSKLEKIFNEVLDEDGNKAISKQEFVQIINNQEATRTMHDLDVDVVGLVDFADVIFAKDLNDDAYENELSFSQFMEVVVAFRGSNTATVKDIENLRKFFSQTIQRCENRVVRLEGVITSVEAARASQGYAGLDRAAGSVLAKRLTNAAPGPAPDTRR